VVAPGSRCSSRLPPASYRYEVVPGLDPPVVTTDDSLPGSSQVSDWDDEGPAAVVRWPDES
jgi:hypothetical protein